MPPARGPPTWPRWPGWSCPSAHASAMSTMSQAPISLGAAPLTIDPTRDLLPTRGPAYIAGFSPRDGDADPDTLDLAVDRGLFETVVWPALAHRVPAFDRAAAARRLGRPLRGQHPRPQRDRRPASDASRTCCSRTASQVTGSSRHRPSAAGSQSGSPPGATRPSTSRPLGYERIARGRADPRAQRRLTYGRSSASQCSPAGPAG